jgi:GNAT superfamily N-acetyltransferase
MSVEHAVIADAVWPNKHPGSEFFLRRLINWNPNVGAFNDKGELMAWCFRLQAGPLGALQVDEKFKRQGLGTLVTKAMIKQLADLGQDTFALVGKDNEPSKKMFENIGFENIDDVYWLRTFSRTGGIEWED